MCTSFFISCCFWSCTKNNAADSSQIFQFDCFDKVGIKLPYYADRVEKMPGRLPSHSSFFNVTLFSLSNCSFFVVSISTDFLNAKNTIVDMIDYLGVFADWDNLVKQSPKDIVTRLFICNMWRVHLIGIHMFNSMNQTQLWDSKNISQVFTCQRPKKNQFVILFTNSKNWSNTEMVRNVDVIFHWDICWSSFLLALLMFQQHFLTS